MDNIRTVEKFTWLPMFIVNRNLLQISWLEHIKIKQEFHNNKWLNKLIISGK
jgi:hypothetical protein